MNESIFLDTSIINGDYQLRSGNLSHLLRVCSFAGLPLVLPEVVLADMVSHHRYELETVANKIRKSGSELERYIFSGAPLGIQLDLEGLLEKYPAWLRKRARELGIVVRGYPKVKHNEIIARASSGRRPFREHDVGYKDTLIWETILEHLAKTNGLVILLSSDHDFGESGLHKDLLDDLVTAGVSHSRISLYKNYESLLDYLYSKHDLAVKLEEEQRVQWASITRKQLRQRIQFAELIASQMPAIERLIVSAKGQGTTYPIATRLVSISERFDLTEFTAAYTGGGVWKIRASALITAITEQISEVRGETPPSTRPEKANLVVNLTAYYDYKNEAVSDVVTNSVSYGQANS